MRNYEITQIYRESSLESVKKEAAEILAKHSVTVSSQEDWGSKTLWHPLNGEMKGHYTLIQCKTEPSIISKLEHEFHLNQNILKTLIVRKDG